MPIGHLLYARPWLSIICRMNRHRGMSYSPRVIQALGETDAPLAKAQVAVCCFSSRFVWLSKESLQVAMGVPELPSP